MRVDENVLHTMNDYICSFVCLWKRHHYWIIHWITLRIIIVCCRWYCACSFHLIFINYDELSAVLCIWLIVYICCSVFDGEDWHFGQPQTSILLFQEFTVSANLALLALICRGVLYLVSCLHLLWRWMRKIGRFGQPQTSTLIYFRIFAVSFRCFYLI